MDQGIVDIEKCIELEPAYTNCNRHLARLYMITGQEQKAFDTFLLNLQSGLTINDFWIVPYFVKHEMHHAAALMMKSEFLGDSAYPYKELLKAIEEPSADHSEGIRKLLAWSERVGRNQTFLWAQWVALGDFDRVEYSVDANGFWLETFKDFRVTPRFKELLIESGALAYWQARGFPQGCRPLGEEDFECD